MLERYFDNAATTPIDPRVREAMLPYLSHDFGNANSLHAWGRKAHEAVESARIEVAESIGAQDPSQVCFTSGATEGNNWILKAFGSGMISPFEHSSVSECALSLGFGVLENDGLTLLPPASQESLVSVMAVNNEIGTRFSLALYRDRAKVIHSDITQAAGKYDSDLSTVDFATFSAHKFYGPKGVGAVYMKEASLSPMLWGGEQEQGLRAGTLNVAGIVGMGVAARIAREERLQDHRHLTALRAATLSEIEGLSDVRVNGGQDCAPHILSVSCLGVEGESIVIELDAEGYGISAGAACSSRSNEPSHVLTAVGLEDNWRRGTVRISFGRFNSEESARGLARALCRVVDRIRAIKA